MKKLLKHLVVATVLLFSSASVFAQQMPPIPFDPNVRMGKLENGLTYYIRHNALPANQADFYIAQKVGSIQEEDNQRGLAHFLEHMCFNGTTNFPDNTLREYLENIGVKFGVNLNAYTSIDETVYNINNVPVAREGVIDSCLLILHDWANDLTLDEKEIDKERGVIKEEWRTRTGAMMRMYEKVFPKLYPDSKYGHRLPIGTMEVVEHFPYQALRDYYKKWYRPDLQGIIVVGDIDVDKIEAKIKNLFSPIKMPQNAAKREYYPVADNNQPIVAIAKDKEQTSTVLQLMFKHEAIKPEEKGSMQYLAINYITDMIASMLNDRLEELRQSANPPFIYAAVGDEDYIFAKTKAAFMGYSVVKEDGILNGLEVLYREMERARQFGFTESEYARAKANYLRSLESAYNERAKTKTNSYVSELVRHFLDNEPVPGIENEYAIMNQIVPSIPLQAINAVLPQLIGENNIVLSLFCPDKESMKYPTESELLGILNKVKGEKLTAYVDKVSNEPLVKTAPKAGKVIKIERGVFGSTIWTLSNGVKVILKPTDFKADEIRMTAFSPGGTSIYPDKDILQLTVLNEVSGLGGLGNFSTTDLTKVLAGKRASASAMVGSLSEGVSGSCSPKDFETMMQLTYLSFTAPRMDQEAFASYINRAKAGLKNQALNPMKAFTDSLKVAVYNHHPRAISLTESMMDKVNYQQVMNFYKDRFADASDFTFVLVGNIDEKAVKPLIETYLGGLPSFKRKENFKDNKMDTRKGVYVNNFTKEMETPKSTVLMLYSGKATYDLKNLTMMSMFDQLLDILYTQTIREDQGGAYGVSCSGDISLYPKVEATLQIYFDTDPAKREKMVATAKEGLEAFIKDGPKAEDLKKVKEYMLKKYTENQKENSYWMGALKTYYWEKVDVNTNYEDLVKSITADDLKAFAKALVSQNNLIEVSMSSPQK